MRDSEPSQLGKQIRRCSPVSISKPVNDLVRDVWQVPERHLPTRRELQRSPGCALLSFPNAPDPTAAGPSSGSKVIPHPGPTGLIGHREKAASCGHPTPGQLNSPVDASRGPASADLSPRRQQALHWPDRSVHDWPDLGVHRGTDRVSVLGTGRAWEPPDRHPPPQDGSSMETSKL